MKEAQEAWLGFYRWQLKIQRDISMAREFPLRRVGSKSQTGLPSIQHQSWTGTQKTSSCEKQHTFCLPRRDGWGHTETLKGPTQKISFAASYHGVQVREERGTRELGFGASRKRTEGTAARIPVLSHSSYFRSHLSQAEHSHE